MVDGTSLKGSFDFVLGWTLDPTMGAASPGADDGLKSDSSIPSLFTALPEHLGLRLELTEEPVDVILRLLSYQLVLKIEAGTLPIERCDRKRRAACIERTTVFRFSRKGGFLFANSARFGYCVHHFSALYSRRSGTIRHSDGQVGSGCCSGIGNDPCR